MANIRVLDKSVSELIAAGEVIERPASIVKELLENAIDAGATSIVIEIRHGGVRYIRITDNGCGIASEDVPNAFLRHSTSKVYTQQDLEHISTLGFRGEALASVCAVSNVEMLTKQPTADFGNRILIGPEGQRTLSAIGCPDGTTIIVRDLFYNVPARLKFLKKDATETAAVSSIVEKLALANPHISFQYIKDGKKELQTPGDGVLHNAIYAVFGKEFATTLAPVTYQSGAIAVSGFVSKPLQSRSNRTMQHFFVNTRYIKSRACAAALEEAYKNTIMVGKFPACILNITLPPGTIDVNVHPAKIEVKFSDEQALFDCMYFAVKNALENLNEKPVAQTEKPTANIFPYLIKQKETATALQSGTKPAQELINSALSQTTSAVDVHPKPPMFGTNNVKLHSNESTYQADSQLKFRFLKDELLQTKPTPTTDRTNTAAVEIIDEQQDKGAFVFLGELFQTYILAQLGEQFLIVDKHAAHERMLFNKLIIANRDTQRQVLLSPISATLSKEACQAIFEHQDVLLELGFLVEDFGGHAILIREVPLMLDQCDVSAMIEEIAEAILLNKRNFTPEVMNDLLHSIACKTAIKAHDMNQPDELIELVRTVYDDPDIRYCPHGRPVILIKTKREIEKMFGRIV